MGYIADLIFRLSGRSGSLNRFFERTKGAEGRANLDALIQYVATYQPNGTYYDYKPEMENRVLYLAGAMQADMTKILERQFPMTHEDYIREMLNLKLVRHIILERAQVFPESTRFVLIDRKNGKELEPDNTGLGKQAKEFQTMIDVGLWHTVSRNADALAQLCHRVALKAWYDQDIEDVRLSAFPPQDVMIVRNPDRPWSPYSAPAVLFRHAAMTGDSLRDAWEVWSTGSLQVPDKEDEHGRAIWLPTAHYMTDGEKEWSINPLDENPFKDPRYNDRPMVPFTWLSDDGGTELYVFGNEDLLTVNRVVNWGMTALHMNVIQQSFAIPYFRVAAGKTAKIPSDMIISPKKAFKLPANVEIGFASPQLDISHPKDFYQLVMKLEAIFSEIDSEAVTVEGRTGELSGRALIVKQTKLKRHLSPLRKIYKWPMEDICAKGIVVRNYYSDKVTGRDKIDLGRFKPTVIYGDLDVPVDHKANAERFQLGIEFDVATAIDWHMADYGVTRDEAKKRIEENAKYNEKARKARRVFPIPGDQDDGDTVDKLPELLEAQPGKRPPEPAKKPAPPPPPEKKAGKDKDKSDDHLDLAKLNVYQLAKLMEIDVVSAIDVRMQVFNEDEATAKRKVAEAIRANLAKAKASAAKQAIEAKAGAPPSKGKGK